jgi:hypothetical protein
MRILTFKELQKELGCGVFCTSLKYDRYGLVRRNQQLAYLLPLTDLPKDVLQYLSISEFRKSIGPCIDSLIQYCKKHRVSATIGLKDAGGEHICYLAIDLNCLEHQ